MSDLGDELERAAGDPEPVLDVAALRSRADQRVRTRRRALAAGACALLLLGGGAAWAASTSEGTQQVAAGDPEAGEPETTTTVIDETTTIFTTTEDTTTTTTSSSTSTSTLVPPPPEESTTSSSTAPPAVIPPDEAGTVEVRGTYTGQERYRFDATECARQDMDLSHVLVSRFTPTEVARGAEEIGAGGWDFKSDYCSRIHGDTWSGSGSWAISFASGAGITGTVEDETAYPTDGEPYQLVIEGGSDQFTGATGTCDLTVRITDKALGRQTQSGEFHCVIELPELGGGTGGSAFQPGDA